MKEMNNNNTTNQSRSKVVELEARAECNPLANSRLAIDLAEHDDPEPLCASIKRFFSETRAVLLRFGVFLKIFYTDAMNRKGSSFLSFFSIFMVVFLCIVMTSTLLNLPILFLRLGETSGGQNDLFIIPGDALVSAKSLNYSMVEELFPLTDKLRGYHAPRIVWSVHMVNFEFCTGVTKPSDVWYSKNGYRCTKGCVHQYCEGPIVRQRVFSVDQYREKRMGFGAKWDVPLLGKGEVIMSKDAAAAVNNAMVGDTILLASDLSGPLREVLKNYSGNEWKFFTIMPMKVVAVVDPNSNKFTNDKFVVIDFNTTLSSVAEGLSPIVSENERDAISVSDPRLCASSIHFNINPLSRTGVYSSSNYAVVRERVSSWVSSVVTPIGFNQITVNTPILRFLATVKFFSLFIGLIVSVILTLVAFLSLVLIYSLFNLSVETRVYEMGIQRMVGFSKKSLALMLIVGAYAFAVPAWILGLLMGQVAYLLLRVVIKRIVGVHLPVLIPKETVGWASLVGLLLPFIGIIVPVFSVLRHNLSESLNSSRGRNIGAIYKIVRNKATSGMHFIMFGLGCAFAVFGFLLFYTFPITMLHMQLSLLYYIFFGTLIGMLVGLVLLALNLEHVLRAAVSYVLFWESKAVFLSVQKCLTAHRRRNRETTMMYAISLGFVVFITVAFQIQLNSFQRQMQSEMGTDVVITFDSFSFLDFSELAAFVRLHLPEVSMLTYLSRSISSNLPVQNVTLSSPGRFRTFGASSLRAIPPNFFEVLNKEFLTVSKYSKSSEIHSISGALYADGRNKVIMSTSAYASIHSHSLQDPVLLVTAALTDSVKKTVKNVRFAVEPTAVLDTAPQVLMSKFGGTPSDVLVSFPSAVRFSAVDFLSVRSMNIEKVSFHIADAKDVRYVSQNLKSYLSTLRLDTAVVRDEREMLEYLGIANRIIGFFFTFTEVMTLIICFFSLICSTTVNVLDSSKEIGILRCIGMTKLQIYRIFAWEAFVVVVSAGFLGVVVGLLVGYTMQLQNYLFTQVSIPFIFPYVQIIITVAMAIGAAVLASYSPVAFLLNMPSIISILHNTS